jgi:hypothetical protein
MQDNPLSGEAGLRSAGRCDAAVSISDLSTSTAAVKLEQEEDALLGLGLYTWALGH